MAAKVAAPKTPAAGKSEAEPFVKSTVREYFESVCVAVILALFVRTFVVQAFKIPTGSMENNLLIGDHLLVNKFVTAPTRTGLERTLLPIDPIRRGDILVFKFPDHPDRDFIKRVIGLPGDTLELKTKTIYINGQPLEEKYTRFLYPDVIPIEARMEIEKRRAFGPVTVPPDSYFMMGDNRDNSEDSRYWDHRFMPRSYVKGRALFVYFSFGDASGLSGTLSNIRWGRMLHQIH